MEQRTLAEALAERARAHPERPALLDGDDRWSYAELDTAVDRAAAGLAAVGVGRGDRVGLLAANGAGFVLALYGAWRAGAVAVPLNTATTAEEARTILADAGVAAIVADHDLREALVGIDDALDQPAEVLDSHPSAWQALAADAELAAADGALLEPDAGPAEPPAPGAPAGLALLAYTAGTTGTPRGAMLTHGHLAANHRQLDATHQRLTVDDVVLGALPMFHIYGLNVGLAYPLACGAAVRCLARFVAESSLDAVAADRVTVMLGVPPMLSAWAGRGPGERDLSALRLAACGAAPLDAAVAERFAAAFGVPVWEGYGLTETAPVLTTTAMGEAPRYGSVGRPVPDVELRLVGERDTPVRRGDPGEVLARGPNVFAGYWRDPERTRLAFTPEGFFRTRDIGYADDEGNLRLVDRKGDLIIVSGFNVYPREVEDVLVRHPAVAAAAAVGVPHERTGEAVVAHVVLRPGAEATPEELIAHSRTLLARFKCPREVVLREELPTAPTGKLMRRKLR